MTKIINTLALARLADYKPEVGDTVIVYDYNYSSFEEDDLHPDKESLTVDLEVLETENLDDDGEPNIFKTFCHWGKSGGKLYYIYAFESGSSPDEFSVFAVNKFSLLPDLSADEVDATKAKYNLR